MSKNKDKKEVISEAAVSTTFRKKLLSYVSSKYGTATLAIIAFIEGFLPVPIITDPFLVVAVMVERAKAIKLTIITTASSVLGGLGAFLVAFYLKDWLLGALSPEAVETLNLFIGADEGTFILTLVGAISPVPYTFVAWAVALSGGNPMIFIIASVIGRGFRYSVVSWCTHTFGPTALRYARRSILITSLVLVVLVVLYIWLKL